jgi:amidase
LICCCGCAPLQKGKATEDATIVARLKAEGAIIVGLTNVPELSHGGESDNLLYGRTNNPYDLTRSPGGSSGGSAAIVSAGGVPLSIGSDGGGSIRHPCHCTGIAGLKPTHGLVLITGGTLGDTPGILTDYIAYGPLARSVDDLFFGIVDYPRPK